MASVEHYWISIFEFRS